MKKILLVEDNLVTCSTLAELLKEYYPFAKVVSVQSLEDGLKEDLESFDLFVLDYHLADGLATRIIQEIVELDKPIVLYTGLGSIPEKEVIQEAVKTIVFLKKPFTGRELHLAIVEATALAQKQKQDV